MRPFRLNARLEVLDAGPPLDREEKLRSTVMEGHRVDGTGQWQASCRIGNHRFATRYLSIGPYPILKGALELTVVKMVAKGDSPPHNTSPYVWAARTIAKIPARTISGSADQVATM